MANPLVVLCFLPAVLGIIYIDRLKLNFDEKLSNWSITYFHDETGNSVTNITFQTYAPIDKAFMYLTAKAAKDRNDKDCQIELLNTVIDAEKFLKGMQGHVFLRKFLNELLMTMDFEPRFPLPAGTYRFVNVTFNSVLLPIEPRGFVDFRIVVKFSKTPKVSTLLSTFRLFGGFRKS